MVAVAPDVELQGTFLAWDAIAFAAVETRPSTDSTREVSQPRAPRFSRSAVPSRFLVIHFFFSIFECFGFSFFF